MPQSCSMGWTKEIVTTATKETMNFSSIFALSNIRRKLANDHTAQSTLTYICSSPYDRTTFVNIYEKKMIASMGWRIDWSLERIAIKINRFRNHDRNQKLRSRLEWIVQGFFEDAVTFLWLLLTFKSIIQSVKGLRVNISNTTCSLWGAKKSMRTILNLHEWNPFYDLLKVERSKMRIWEGFHIDVYNSYIGPMENLVEILIRNPLTPCIFFRRFWRRT